MIKPQKLYIFKRNMFVRQKCQTALFRMICVQLVEDAHCNGGYIEYSIFCYLSFSYRVLDMWYSIMLRWTNKNQIFIALFDTWQV